MSSKLLRILPHVGAIFIFLAVAALYFQPQLEGKVVQQGDIVQYEGMAKEVDNYRKQTGVLSLWTNAMFGGMPTFKINTIKDGNFLQIADHATRLFTKEPIGRFVAAMICFYIMMIALGSGPLMGIVGAIAFGLTTNNLILFEAGHNTKVRAISFLPLIAAGLLLSFQGKRLWGGALFALGIGVNVMSDHVQMSYYFFLTLLIFGVAQLVYDIQRGQLAEFAKSAGVLIIAGLLGLGSTASNLLPTYEYSRDTMRGAPILKPEPGQTNPQSSSETEGLAWDYAMQWSNGGVDLFSAFIPGVAGGGSQEMVGPNSAIATDLRAKGARIPAQLPAPLYWGNLPFTSGPIYFGAVVFFLALVGMFWVQGPVKWWLAGGTLLTFLLSLGSTLPGFNHIFFDYVPLYNKFRTPNSVLSVTAFLLPLLGFLGLIALHKASDEQKGSMLRGLQIAMGTLAAICLFFWLMGPSFFAFSTPGDERYVSAGYDINAIIADRKALMQSDALRSLALILLSGGLIWAYMIKKIPMLAMLAGIGLLSTFDLWTVGRRYLNEEDFVNPTNYKENFAPRPVDEEILKDKDPNYRVMDLTANTFNSTQASYYHKSIGGYHAAKLQRYQDMIDRHFSKGNQRTLDMLNTRYFITAGENDQPRVQRNPGALGNAWFIDTIRWVETANQEIDALNDFEPAREAVILQPEFASYMDGFKPDTSGGTITLTDYLPWQLTYQSDASQEQLAVFSEVWYGPNKGWQAYIDDQPVEHIRANYLLRAMRIPAGKHKITFTFDPASYRTGKLISTLFSSAILLSLLGLGGTQAYRYFTTPEPVAEDKPRKAAPAAAPDKKGRKK